MVALVMFAFSIMRAVLGGLTQPDPGPGTSTTAPAGGSTSGTTGGGAAGTGTVEYENEGYQAPPADFNPPDLPIPTTVSQAQSWLTNNALYPQDVPSPTRCGLPAVSSAATTAELEKDLNDLMGCLMQVWEQPMEAAGFEMPRPPVTVYSSPVTTACGTMREVNAAYCAGDQRVYYARRLLSALPRQIGGTPYAAEVVIAHEFGHAVQARSGILIADKALEQRASEDAARVMSRRTEQQADCFAGLFVGSVAQSQNLAARDLQNLVDMTYYLGDDALSGEPDIEGDHGLGKNRQAWFAKGLPTNQIGVCNTWVAPAASVR
jgi:predicted metalloprotease